MSVIKCTNCGGTNVETKAWVKYKCGEFVVSDFCEEGWTCWDCEIEDVDVTEEDT